MSELIITWQGLLFEIVSFLIFTYFLNLFLFKPIRNILKKRSEIINSENENKKKFEDLAYKLNKDAFEERNKLKNEINKIKEIYRKDALTEASIIVSSAKKDASIKFDKDIKDFEEEKKIISGYYKSKSLELADLISKKILE